MAAQTRRSARLSATLLGRCGTPVLVPTRAGPGQHRSPVPALPAPGTWSSRLSRMSHRDLYRLSIVDPDQFWGSAAADRLRWSEPFHRVRDCDLSTGRIAWFLGGKINVSVNCLDVHVETHPDRVALIWERDEPGTEVKVTYRELLDTTCRLANTLKSHGIQKGDRVAVYMPVSPLAVASMLACARIGAVHTVVFAGFSSEALAGRIQDAQCKAVVTFNQGVRGGRLIDLKATVDSAVKNCPTVQHVFVAQRTENPAVMGQLDVPLEEAMSSQSPVCPAEPLDSEDLLFLLYTSGSTGKPKGIVHTQAGYLLYTSLTHQYVFDHQDGDVFGCVADVGWITGHSYVVYGPLCNGSTTVLFESTPVYPDPGRYWETVQRLKISQFYGAPTALRLLLKYDESFVKKYDRSSLRTLGSVGEPINHEAWHWFQSVVGEGRCPVVDTWWQTETGGVCIAPRPAEEGAAIVPAMAMRPFFGIQPSLLGEKGEVLLGDGVGGALCISQSWPGMARGIHGDQQRFLEAYFKPFPGYYFTGDGALRSADGFYQITGRMDDVINVSGHRLGTAEIEDALDEHPAVPEAAVIGFPHEIKGEVPFAFVVLKEDFGVDPPLVLQQLRDLVSTKIARYAVPEHFLVVKRLPKTRSGKIMRRILRKVAMETTGDLGDVSTLDDPSVVMEIIEAHKQYRTQRGGDKKKNFPLLPDIAVHLRCTHSNSHSEPLVLQEELLAVMRRCCEALLQDLRRLLEENQEQKLASCDKRRLHDSTSTAAKGDAQLEMIHQSDAQTGETSSSFSRRTNLSPHLRVHSRERPFTCSTCGKCFSDRSSVRVHQLTVHGDCRPFRCSHCGKPFGTRSHLRAHLAPGRPLACTACGETLAAWCCQRAHRLTCRVTAGGFRCADCGKDFSKRSYLSAHRRVHLTEKPFRCPTCKKGFTTRRSVHVHQLTVHKGLRPFTCGVCRKTFGQRGGLAAHMRTHTGERPHTCEQCGNSFSSSSGLSVHRRVHTGEKAFDCNTCGKSFSVAGNLRRHHLVHSGRRHFSCDVCGRGFTQAAHLKAHRAAHSGEWAFICEACGKGFGQRSALLAHERGHAGIKPHGCGECGKSFSSAASLRRHQLAHGGRKVHTCDQCGKSFTSAQILKTHRRLHAGGAAFSCDVCGRSYSSLGYLRTHRRSHSEGKPFGCARCAKTFSARASAKLHERTHSGEKPYVCEVCGRSFSASQNLVRHARVHSGEKPYECGVCGKRFSQNNNLKSHLLVHSGLKPFSCCSCSRRFASSRSLKEHKCASAEGWGTSEDLT